MGEAVWDGVTCAETLKEVFAAARHQLADAAKRYDWDAVFNLLERQPDQVNTTRPDGKSLFTVLHQAAYGGAPTQVVERLIRLGAWRTLRNAAGQRALDIAVGRGHTHLTAVLEPVLRREVSHETLQAIQGHFHTLIRERAEALITQHALRLPELEPLLEIEQPSMSFTIPGMYGGFYYRLDQIGGAPVLVCESWSRVEEGSGQRHVISPYGYLLIEKGFV